MKLIVFLSLVLLVLTSAFGLVYSKHRSRTLFVEMQTLQKNINKLEADWGRLQLEQSAWSGHGRIERLAHEKLNMKIPDVDSIIYIKP